MSAKVLAHMISAAILLSAVALWSQSAESPVAALYESLPNGPMHNKAVTACTECHEARIIVQQRLSKPAWTKEVDKMVKWGAVVDAADHDPLIDYLSSNFGPDRPAYRAPRTAVPKSSQKPPASH